MSVKAYTYIRRHHLGLVAIFVALSGTAYAADGPLAGQDTVGSADIIDAEVREADVGQGSVASDELRNESIANRDIAPDSITGGRIADGGLSGADVANDSLTGADVDEDTLVGGPTNPTGLAGGDLSGTYPDPQIAANAVRTGEIRDGEVGSTDLAATARVPTGAVVFMNAAACPAGWSALAPARGRYVVGLPPGGDPGNTVGTALGPQENRATGRHTHAVSDPGHAHAHGDSAVVQAFPGFGTVEGGASRGVATLSEQTESAMTGLEVRASGGVPGTNAPYIQLQVCEKQ